MKKTKWLRIKEKNMSLINSECEICDAKLRREISASTYIVTVHVCNFSLKPESVVFNLKFYKNIVHSFLYMKNAYQF